MSVRNIKFDSINTIYRKMETGEITEIVQRLRISKRWKELALNLSFISRGIKPGLLWDLGNINTPRLLELRIILQDIFVLDIAGDFFISSRESYTKHLQNLETNFPTVIDISSNLTVPRLSLIHI